MSDAPRVLLINPTITGKRHARFPLAVLSLATALEGRYAATILDGNIDREFVSSAERLVGGGGIAAVGVTVMGGPQLLSAIAVSKAIRARAPGVPIIWGGAFPTGCPEATVNATYVDYAVRSQGEETLVELLDALTTSQPDTLPKIRGVSWGRDGCVVHNPERAFSPASLNRMLPYDTLENPRQYLTRTYLGARTAGYQAALGCRFRCTFCGVATMYRGKTALPPAARLEQDRRLLAELGGTLLEVRASDTASGLIQAARTAGACQLVIGSRRRPHWPRLLKGSTVADQVLSMAGALPVQVVNVGRPDKASDEWHRQRRDARQRRRG